jgi:transcriptional regulator with XRE-family HTH domain
MNRCRNPPCMSSDGRIRSEEVAIKFGRNLWRCRRRAALSQEELGARASLHRTEIGMLEHGTRLARVDTLMKLAGALSVSPSELLEGIHWTPGISSDGGFAISERTLPRRRGDDCG